MARLWNTGTGTGDQLRTPTVKRRDKLDGKVKDYVRVPALFTGCMCGPSGVSGRITWDGTCRCGNEQMIEHRDGNVYLALPGWGFFTIPREAYFDVPGGVPIKAIRSMCPHLVTQEEYESQQAEKAPAEKPKPSTEKPKNN